MSPSPSTPAAPSPRVTVIRAPQRWPSLGVGEVWAYRDLIYLLAWRDVKVRYKQTLTGFTWAILQPLLTMVVFSVLFGRLARLPSDGMPYPLFAFAGLVPWTYFVHALTKSTVSLVSISDVLKKAYFPRLVAPLAAVLAGFMDFVIAFVLLLGLMAYYGIAPTAAVWTLPLFMALIVATALAVGLWLAALNVQYRDVANALPFVTQIGLFLTPIAYSSSLIPEAWQLAYALNPMAGVVNGFRWALLGAVPPPGAALAVSVGVVAVLLVSGLYFFRRQEETFADVV